MSELQPESGPNTAGPPEGAAEPALDVGARQERWHLVGQALEQIEARTHMEIGGPGWRVVRGPGEDITITLWDPRRGRRA